MSPNANRLINSTSPYLLQHAYNPVDWFEWGTEALEKAVRENKPILVSIGYSSCHWCHVMEREVFEDESLAKLMNETLVCIKVDREERPDIDSIYMDAVQAMGVNGGWPLNVFLTPAQKPFYGGTYFPPDQWRNVLNGISNAFRTRRDEIEQSANQLAAALKEQDTSHYKKVYEFTDLKTELDKSFSKLSVTFDRSWGGLDKAPKFIMPSVWLWMLRYHHITKNEEALKHLHLTLTKIAWGGIYDQVGGGFARYSVDAYWFAPHFEKMLYDNAQLLSLYAEAYAVTKDPLFKTIVIETFEWLQGEMMNSSGGFYSALDADSEGEEGKYYVWKKTDIDQLLGADAKLVCEYYNIKEQGNWEHGNNILIRTNNDERFVAATKLSQDDLEALIRKTKDVLLAHRDQRIKPGLDDKIITSWNAMTVIGLTDAYRYIGDNRFIQAAEKNMVFLENNLIEGLAIYRSFKNKRSATTGFLDDYAYVIQAYIRLYQVTFKEKYLSSANNLMEYVLEKFHDPEDGFFFYSSEENEKLIARKKEIFDNVIPASNSVMVQNLFQLGTLLDIERYKVLAESITTPLVHLIVGEPNYMSNWAIGYLEIKHGLAEVVIAADKAGDVVKQLGGSYQPFALMIGADNNSTLPLAVGKKVDNGHDMTIYVCHNRTCRRPVHDAESAIREIEAARE